MRLGALFDDSTYHRDERDQYEHCHQFHTFVLSTLGKAAAQLRTYIFRLITATAIEGAYTDPDRRSVMRVTCHRSTLLQRGWCNYTEALREFRKVFISTVRWENNGNQSKADPRTGYAPKHAHPHRFRLGTGCSCPAPRFAPFTSQRTPCDGREENLPLMIPTPRSAFWALNERRPMTYNKKTKEGVAERIALLAPVFPDIERPLANRPPGVGKGSNAEYKSSTPPVPVPYACAFNSGTSGGLRMASDWLTVEESARLLRRIFPAYPELRPCNPVPPKNTWMGVVDKSWSSSSA